MADIRDWGRFVRGRWDWTSGGYEAGFPRRCQFTDIDAAIEMDGRELIIEPKHHDGLGPMSYPDDGQLLFLRNEIRRGASVIVLYGCGPCNSPWGARVLGLRKERDHWLDWRDIPDVRKRRRLLKAEIDRALGL